MDELLRMHPMDELSRMHPADVDAVVEKSTESAAEYDQQIKLGLQDLVHRQKFTCAGCGQAMGYGPPGGIGSDVYHPACAEIESAARRAWNLKRAMG